MNRTMTYEYGGNLYINMTNQCPNRCDFCVRNNSSGSIYADNLWYEGTEPTREELWEDLQKRELGSYRSIVFCGYGEPTCRLEDLLFLAEQLKRQGDYTLRVNTNGLSDPINGCDTAARMAGKIDIVSVSLNAADREQYDRICHSSFGPAAFDAMLKFTENAVKYGIRTNMTVVDTMPKKEIEKCRAICEGLGASFRVREYIPN